MKITIKSLELINFKGIRSLKVNFKENTNISGKNKAGKTTLFDAFCYLLFGKNSQDQEEFNIKTLDINNKVISKLDHEVIGVLDIDDIPTTLRRVYKEKWTKPRGVSEAVFSGHETNYFIDTMPVQQKAYQEHISNIIPELTFKILTNPYYFNQIKWEKRREMLFKLVPTVSDEEIAFGFKEFEALMGKDLDKRRIELSAKRLLLKDSLDEIPIRVSEINRDMPQVGDLNEVKKQINELQKKYEEVDKQIASKNQAFDKKNKDLQERKNKVFELKRKLSDIKFRVEEANRKNSQESLSDSNTLDRKIKSLKASLAETEDDVLRKEKMFLALKEQKGELLKRWESENAKAFVFDEDSFTCPVNKDWECPFGSQEIESQKEKAQAAFNAKKLRNLEDIEKEGKEKAEKIALVEAEIAKLKENDFQKQIDALTKERGTVSIPEEADYTKEKDYIETLKEIDGIDITEVEAVNTSELKKERTELFTQLDVLKKQLTLDEVITANKNRITVLEEQGGGLAQEIADIEKEIFTIDKFIKAKVEYTEERINAKFHGVWFKMYNKLINGNYEPCCDTIVEGVPWNDLNHSGQINAGISIINTLSEYFDIYAPIFIDNAEAVNYLTPVDTQIIKLFVTTEDELTIT
jgi:hypothetical protein